MFCLALYLSASLVGFVASTEHGLAKFEAPELGVVPMDISLKKHTMLTVPGTRVHSPLCSIQTVNLHDFDMGLVALKAVDKGRCYIKPTPENFDQVKKLIEEFKNGRTEPVKQSLEGWTVPKEPLPSGLIKSKVGERIAEFCTGYKVYVLEGQKILETLKDLPERSETSPDDSCTAVCGICTAILM